MTRTRRSTIASIEQREPCRDARVHHELARIHVAAVRGGDLFGEAGERAVVIAFCGQDHSAQPMKPDGGKRRLIGLVLPLRVGADRGFTLGAIDRAARHEHHARQHPRRGKAGHQRQRAIDRAQPLLAPAAVGEPIMMPPVLRLERRGAARRRLAFVDLPAAHNR